MPRFQHTSAADSKHPHVGRCLVDIGKTIYDDESFKRLFGESKEKIGNCDIQDNNYVEPGHEVDPSETLNSNSNRKNLPNAEVAVTEAGEKYVPSCAKHASRFRDTQLRSIADLQNIRPYLNEGESNEARWHFKERSKHLLDRANQYWNSLVKQRMTNKYNSGTENRNKVLEKPKNAIESVDIDEVVAPYPMDLKSMIENPSKYNGWMDD